jgi:putative membrane protein
MPPGSSSGSPPWPAASAPRNCSKAWCPEWLIIGTGTLLVLFSAFCFGAAVWRQVDPGAPPPRPDIRRLPPAMLMTVNGFLALVAVAALLGIWFGKTGGD